MSNNGRGGGGAGGRGGGGGGRFNGQARGRGGRGQGQGPSGANGGRGGGYTQGRGRGASIGTGGGRYGGGGGGGAGAGGGRDGGGGGGYGNGSRGYGGGNGRGYGGGRGGGSSSQPAAYIAGPASSYSAIGTSSCTRFIANVLRPCKTAKLAAAVMDGEAMWTASWRQAATLDGTTLKTLLETVARLPPSANIPPPRLGDVTAAVTAFLRYSGDANNVFGPGMALEEAKLRAVEVVEEVFKRLTKFVWRESKGDVENAFTDMLADAEKLLELRYPTHRKARDRVSLLFAELDKPWTIRVARGSDDAAVENDADGSMAEAVISWKRPTIAWLSDWNNFQALKLPQMKVPGGRGDGVYDSPEEYFDTTTKLWTGMTFVDGNNALLPHCTIQMNGKVCDQPLWPMQARGYADYHCRSNGCGRLVEFVCANRQHHVGLCKACALDRQQKLRGPASSHASTHIYDASVRSLRYDGKMYLADVASRRPPLMPIHWKTTRRLASPNLVGILVLSGRGASLKLSDEIYWAKIALHGAPRDEFREREGGRVALELLEYTVDEVGNPLLARELEQGASVAIIDCQTFVPEFIPVLKALERQQEMPMPFQSGALVNLKRIRENHAVDDDANGDGDDVDDRGGARAAQYSSDEDSSDSDEDIVAPIRPVRVASIPVLIAMLVAESMLDPIVQIRRDAREADFLRRDLVSLVTKATLDRGQLVSFIDALRHPVHCTQGPPGTGKSYLGVVIVRALLIIRKLWMRVNPSVGEPPILVLSYKNHAIDEFLVDLVTKEHTIQNHNYGKTPLVRLGGGCSNPMLFPYQESNVVATAPAVAKLSKELDHLHKLGSTVRNFRNSFGVIHEAQVLAAGGDPTDSSGDVQAQRDSVKVLARAASTLATVSATIRAFAEPSSTPSGDTEDDSENDSASASDTAAREERETTKLVSVAKQSITAPAVLTHEDIKTLYDGIRHYDAQMDPAEIIYKWMSGFVPLPACAYEQEECAKLVDSDETVYCSRHRCHFEFVDDLAESETRCDQAVELDHGYCSAHLCASDDCGSAVFRETAAYCEDHACFVCIREDLPVREAKDEPPRNTCDKHPLCFATPCENLASSQDSTYCAEHALPNCRGVTRSGKACANIAVSRSTPYCHSHRELAEQQRRVEEASASASVGATSCAATTAKGRPCKGKPVPGKTFCVNHLGRSIQVPVPPTETVSAWANTDKEALAPESGDARESPRPPGGPSDRPSGDSAARSAVPVNREATIVSILDEEEESKAEEVAADDDASSIDSEEFVDCAIDSSLPIDEDDYDEPDHIQHLRDVDEVESGGEDEDEFEFDEDSELARSEHGDEDENEGGEVLVVSDWHWDMALENRWQAIRALLRQWDPIAHAVLRAIHSTFNQTKRELFEEQKRARMKIYEGRALIGGTITGCVTRLEAIRATKPFAILVEEASEVLEPLLFACLGSTTCKLEMIGDHLQLQPSVNSKFDFERINKINISMFERLIRAPPGHEVPSSVLSIQRRMRKNIADLTREFYADITEIEDHEVCLTKTIKPAVSGRVRGLANVPVDKVKLAVSGGREVLGVAPHLFFWTHKGREERASVGLSKMNTHEADMACHLAKYLTQCGVPSTSIAILTPYKGQLMYMRRLLTSKQFGMGKATPDGRYEPTCTLSTVDRFQGDEADVVIVSLVIDGKSKTPFVKLQNRMIVLLSRARIGMYIVGNIEYFTNAAASAPAHWQATIDMLHDAAPSDSSPAIDAVWPPYAEARLGDALPLCCPQHRESVHLAKKPNDLQLTFCQVICPEPLSCTHVCGKRCHWATIDQHTTSCKMLVESPCTRHPRQLKCADVCKTTKRTTIQDAVAAYRCDKLVDLQLPCTHVQKVPCAQEVDVLRKTVAWPQCTEKALTPFVYPDCKHELQCKCVDYYAYQPDGGRQAPHCTQTVDYVPACGHATQLKCYLRADFMIGRSKHVCKHTVKCVLPRCGHDATLPCPVKLSLESWRGTTVSFFGVVDEGAEYGPTDHMCTKMVTFRRQCGHEASVQCSAAFSMASNKPPCGEKVEFVSPECGHVHQTTCADAARLRQRVAQLGKTVTPPSAVTVVKEQTRMSCFQNFGLGIACQAKVTLQRECGHEREMSCHQARSTNQPCAETVCVKRPDCGHDCVFPCSMARELQSWNPWSQPASLLTGVLQTLLPWSGSSTKSDDAVQLLLSSGVLSTSLPPPSTPTSSAIQTNLKPCKQTILLRRDATCGHEVRLPCEQAMKILRGELAAPTCRVLTTKALPCGHTVEMACHLDVSSVRCKETVAKPCWNSEVCHQTVKALCSAESGVLQCDSRVVWTCSTEKHEYHVPICRKGEPAACPGCSYDALVEAIETTRLICTATGDTSVPWPPVGMSSEVMTLPSFATTTALSDDDKTEFYGRQLAVLERFKNWIEQDEDVWSRALFRPLFVPVFAVVDPSKDAIQPCTRFERKDFGSIQSWTNVEAYPLNAENAMEMIPAEGGGGKRKKKTTPQPRRVVFGVVFSLGLNVSPSDAPASTVRFGPKHVKWIEKQQQELGYDSAFFGKKRDGAMVEAGLLRVWEPFAMFPTAEARVQASDRKVVADCMNSELGESMKAVLQQPPSRFLAYKSLATSPSGTSGATGSIPTQRSALSSAQETACTRLLEALSWRWARNIRLSYPWSGKQLLVGSEFSLPESVEQQLHDKVTFMRGHGSAFSPGAKKKKNDASSSPFSGLNLLQKIDEKQPFAEVDLFGALELLEVRKSDSSDALAKLESYVSRMQQLSRVCHPLVLVALARSISRDPKISPRVQPAECLVLFQELYPEAAELWLTQAEKELVASKGAGGTKAATTKADEDAMTVEQRWQKLKAEQNVASEAMDELLKMVGLARVKRFAINMFKSALAFQRMTATQRKKNAMAMNYCFVGNPGTGKTTVAKLFARILHDSRMRRLNTALLCSAQELKDSGADKFRDQVKKAMGGVVFIDEAYELEPLSDPKGKPIVAEVLFAAEEYRHDLSMILAGYEDDIQQKLYAYNDGLRSRFTEVVFDDFDEADLRVIWDGMLKEREWTCEDKVSTIACRRLARGAGRKGFGNARAVRQLFEHAMGEAMAREDFDGVTEMRAVDVIGERPSKNEKLRSLMNELESKIGWKRIKQRVKEIISVCNANYERELNGQETLSIVMNRLFLGNPGTGKTTCAKLYGKLLKHLGFLSNGEVVAKTAGDFVGQYIGQSQTKTNEILKLAKGKVLIIDEAYNLNDNLYGKQVLDVLVEKVQGSDNDDIAVILIGYEHQMAEMLRTQNPGLARRFPIEYAFYFDDYDDHELYAIFSAACARKNVYCPLAVEKEVVKLLSMQRRQANFGNAGAVETLLKNAMANASKRPMEAGETKMRLQLEDIENEMTKRSKDDDDDAAEKKEPEDPLCMLDKLYRMDNIKDELQRLRTRIQVAEEEGEERPEIGHFIFRGSPGTGKTTVARAMGKILHHMGLLGSDRVVETSGLNLTGEYLGQTKKKVEKQLGQARGAILFIDEAYELGKGMYGEEAMTTLVAAMTDSIYAGMVIILAGYPADMDAMLDRNAGLKSRFTRFLDFPDWEASDCIAFLKSRSAQEKYQLSDNAVDELEELFEKMRVLPGFGNGRDVDKVWKSVLECRAQRVVGHPELERTITLLDVKAVNERVLAARRPPEAELLSRPELKLFERPQGNANSLEPPRVEFKTNASVDESKKPDDDEAAESDSEDDSSDDAMRDPGVSDAVWEELERAKEAYKQLLRDLQEEEDRTKREAAQRKVDAYKAAQEKLRRLAKCPAGFEWKQVGGGWRCGGGSHYVSNAELERNFMY